jgi:hypothetical protein
MNKQPNMCASIIHEKTLLIMNIFTLKSFLVGWLGGGQAKREGEEAGERI